MAKSRVSWSTFLTIDHGVNSRVSWSWSVPYPPDYSSRSIDKDFITEAKGRKAEPVRAVLKMGLQFISARQVSKPGHANLSSIFQLGTRPVPYSSLVPEGQLTIEINSQ